MLYSQVYGTDDVAQFEQCVKPARLAVLAVLRPWQTNTTSETVWCIAITFTWKKAAMLSNVPFRMAIDEHSKRQKGSRENQKFNSKKAKSNIYFHQSKITLERCLHEVFTFCSIRPISFEYKVVSVHRAAATRPNGIMWQASRSDLHKFWTGHWAGHWACN